MIEICYPNIIEILKYCRNIVQILSKYCPNIVNILSKYIYFIDMVEISKIP